MKNVKFLFGSVLLSLTVLTGCSSDDSNPDTNTDPVEQNGKILFQGTVGNSDDYHLFVMNIDGSNGAQLTNFTNAHTGDALWSSDGSKIVFQTSKDNDGGSGIYTMNADGSNITRVNHNFIGEGEQNPTFSPDGTKILFEALIGINSHIFVMNADGNNEIQLTSFTNGSEWVHSGDASWSPDGSKIVFQSNKDSDNDGGSGIYIMNSDGSNVTRINHSFIGDGEQNPKFSPDGSKILFEAQMGNHSHIFVMNTDGSNETQLTNFTSGNEYTYTGDASWNPDGSKIVFQSNKDSDNDGGSGIYIMNDNGSNVIRISQNLARGEENPAWK